MESQNEEPYSSQVFGNRIGFGSSPCVLVVDFINAYTDTSSPLGSDLTDAIANTKRVIDAARLRDVPVIYTSIAYGQSELDTGLILKKVPAMQALLLGRDDVEIDGRLSVAPEELIVVKKSASAFGGTPLSSQLIAQKVDTVLLTGCSTSGCVRATAVDAIQMGFRPIVIRECVGDRSQRSHEVSLMDIDARYGDVVSVEDVLSYLQAVGTASTEGSRQSGDVD